MRCFSMGRDQPMIASCVAQLGRGTTLDPQASVAEIRGGIAALLDDGEARRASTFFAHSIARHPGLEEATAAIEELL